MKLSSIDKNRKTIKNLLKNEKMSYGHFDISQRRTGRTTALALQYIGKALGNPNSNVITYDHFTYVPAKANRYCLDMCKRIVKNLELDGFVFNNASTTITFELKKWEDL